MKRKAVSNMLLGLLLISVTSLGSIAYSEGLTSGGSSTASSRPFPANRPVLFVDPDVIEQDVGIDFTVSVKIFNLTDAIWTDPATNKLYPLGNLYGVGMNLSWDPTVLEYVDHLVKIPIDDYPDGILYSPTTEWENNVNPAAGYYKMAYSSQNPAPPFNNPGQNNTVFEITFRALREGSCDLLLTQVQLSGKLPGDRVFHEGYATNTGRGAVFSTLGVPIPPKAPTALFTYSPVAPKVGETATFDASVSYDPDGTITSYSWDFGDSVVTSETSSITTHTYAAAGTYVVTLTVTDNDGLTGTIGASVTVAPPPPPPPSGVLILFDQTHGTDYYSTYGIWINALVARGYIIDTWTDGSITPGILSQYDIFVIPQAHTSYTSSELSAIQSFVNGGKGLLVIGDDMPSFYTDLTSFAGITWTSGGGGGYTNDVTPHPVTDGVTTAYFSTPLSNLHTVSPAIALIRDNYGNKMLAVSDTGLGKVIGIADEQSIDDWDINAADNFRLANNMIDWLVARRPEHELLVTVEVSPILNPNTSSLLKAAVYNRGLSDETNVELQLLINGTIVDSAITELPASSIHTIDYLWTPTVESLYNITVYAPPVIGETVTINNKATAMVTVIQHVKAAVLDSWGTDYAPSTWQTLNALWRDFGNTAIYIDYTALNKEDITYEDLVASDADVLIISCAYAWQFTDVEIAAITRYVKEGHGLIATAGTLYEAVPNNNKLAPLFGLSETVSWTATGTNMLDILEPTHPIFTNIPDPYYMPSRTTVIPYDHSWDSNELTEGTYLALGPSRESAIVVNNGLVFISPWVEYMPTNDDLQLLYNAIVWSKYVPPLQVNIEPQVGPVGDVITLTGNEATPLAQIQIYFDNTLLGTTTADPDGNFVYTLTIPASVAGSHNIKAMETLTHRAGRATFTVVASISPDPLSGPVGTKLTVYGHGFAANVTLTITLDDMLMAAWIVTDETGSFTGVISLPVTAVGPHTVKAFSHEPERLYAEAIFTVIDVDTLDVNVEVGEIFFKGETAEFYVQISLYGKPIDATVLNIVLYDPSGIIQTLTAQRIATGLYRVRYAIAGKSSMIGTYTLVVEAGYATETADAHGTSIKAFLVKSTWEREMPKVAAFSIASLGLVSAMVVLWRREKKRLL